MTQAGLYCGEGTRATDRFRRIIAARGALPRPARLPLGVAVAIFFVAGDFPYFIAQAEPAWWRPS